MIDTTDSVANVLRLKDGAAPMLVSWRLITGTLRSCSGSAHPKEGLCVVGLHSWPHAALARSDAMRMARVARRCPDKANSLALMHAP